MLQFANWKCLQVLLLENDMQTCSKHFDGKDIVKSFSKETYCMMDFASAKAMVA